MGAGSGGAGSGWGGGVGGREVEAGRGGAGTHPQQAHEGEQAVPQRPLVLALEHLGLQQLQDPQHVHEEGQVVLLAELLEVEVRAAVQEGSDHGQVPAAKQEPPGCGRPPAPPLRDLILWDPDHPPAADARSTDPPSPAPPGLACQQP